MQGGAVRNEKRAGMVNRRTSSEHWQGGERNGNWRERDGGPVWREEVGGTGALASPIQPIYEGFIGVGVRMRKAAQALAAGCKSENVIADAAGPETFTLGESLRLLASAVGAHVGLVRTPASLGFA